jgi:hypothetical protein
VTVEKNSVQTIHQRTWPDRFIVHEWYGLNPSLC